MRQFFYTLYDLGDKCNVFPGRKQVFNYKNTSPSPSHLLNFVLPPTYSFVFPSFNSFDFLHSYFFFYPPPVDFSIFFFLYLYHIVVSWFLVLNLTI